MPRDLPRAKVIRNPMPLWLGLTGGLVMGAMAATLAWGEGHENVTVSHGFTNFGDLMHAADIPHLPYVNPEAPKGGEIAVWSQGNFDSFNPYSRKGVSAAYSSIGHERILTSVADDAYGLYCYMCTTLEYPDSLDWVIFNLRDDVTFADGSPMTAEDVKFTFELFLEQGITEYRNVVEQYIAGVEVLDPYRIRFTFTEDAPRRDVISIAGGSTVFSKAWFEENGARLDETVTAPFMGTGPYVLESSDIGRQIVYARNPDHWGADHPMQVGQNNFDRIRVEYFADSLAALEAFKAGEYTFRIENSSKEWATAYDFPGVENGDVVKAELPNGNIASGQSFVFNLRREKWQDPKVREAVRLMFNFEWSNETLFFGAYERVNSFWENSSLEATGAPGEGELALLKPLVEEELLDASILTEEAILAPTSGTRTLDRRNLRAASALLDEAGWEVGADGIRTKNGERLTAVFLQVSPQWDRIVNPFIENLSRLGIEAKLERVDPSEYQERRRSSNYDLTNHSFFMGFEPGIGLRQWYDSSTAVDSSRNLMGLQNPAIDRLITHVIEAQSLEEMTTATHALDRALRHEGFWIPQWFKDTHWVAYYDMYRHPDPLPPFALGHLTFWWYDQEAADALAASGALD